MRALWSVSEAVYELRQGARPERDHGLRSDQEVGEVVTSEPSSSARDDQTPKQGSLLRVIGLGDKSGLFRVINEPEPDGQGTVALELESVASPDGI